MWWIFLNWQTTLECVLTALILASLLSVVAFKPLGILQGFGYKGASLLRWSRRKSNLTQARYSVLSLACALACAVISLCFGFAGAHWSAVTGLAAYLIFFVLYAVAEARRSIKGCATLTPRFKRLLITLWVVLAVLIYIAVTLLNFAEYAWGFDIFATLKYCVLAVFPLALLPIICLANLITKLWEAPINKSYQKKAKAALAASSLKV
ncbi:MAG: hypothetical protein K2O67_01310, partial [Clostridia bacterium]|nr:hypothetical protein [Clostridia bacterium]